MEKNDETISTQSLKQTQKEELNKMFWDSIT